MKEKTKKVRPGQDLIKIERSTVNSFDYIWLDSIMGVFRHRQKSRHCPAAYHLFHRVHDQNSCHDQMDEWRILFGTTIDSVKRKNVELISSIVAIYLDGKDVAELLRYNLYQSIPRKVYPDNNKIHWSM